MTKSMNEHKGNIFGAVSAWCFTGWAFFESHSSAIAALFAVLASIATIYSVLRKNRRDKP